ncbi:MAG: PEP/pyruvate-binding domain-containing protein, partial [Pseudarthrobacter sp.]
MTYVNNLGDVGQGDVALAGGKAVGLGGLIQAGLPVPQGFVLNTAGYAEFVGANHLEADIRALATLSPQASPQDYEDASGRIRALFTRGTMPSAIEAELGAAYGRLGHGNAAVAVRSSATAEDLASASFAGQQETYLNVVGPEALHAA